MSCTLSPIAPIGSTSSSSDAWYREEVSGIPHIDLTYPGYTLWMYAKKYCSDGRIVGVRRRTTLAGWQVLGQGIGFSLGPFLGGLLWVF